MRRFDYHRAETLEHASRLLTELGDDTFLFNGGTDLLVEIRERLRRVRNVVDIKQIPGLSDITYDETRGLTFGALVSVGRLERLPLVRERYPNLRSALASLGSIQVRNRATVVGNVCRASPSADTIPPLIADGAFIHIYSRTNMRVVPLSEFFTGAGRTVLERGEIVTGITVPPASDNAGKAYLKHGRRKAMELSTVGVAVSLAMEGSVCSNIRIALGAVGATVLRAPEAERILLGSTLDAATIRSAARKAMEECTPISNVRASADYRRDMVGVLTGRAINQALEALA
ncbi:xanthine dehydrogenase family protein subunit M (plasmid) [Ensifer adhaerens]|uniref:FAD binding domain-containing protein n=1 Tax=Ensifer adhaerens TaxID=106592 RepID=UPI001CBE10CE|nr:xanthine dehydrogenase family protein subunit M [Ensifer adhaerens]MBZ7927397.1 xanthine dehydrogenase family protein subunit M [Ensifer adhaerens]UAX97829.1 xanthine dehydrogenase family protein subunit M [Ensifer adhaerens]UAY05208.1 xanthine dehydrogenase family protein subunit M [Ensifer adhaerens]UAY12586.1 xanthine dehydrogenase family protein subunit M [Ensifer adhaerens]